MAINGSICVMGLVVLALMANPAQAITCQDAITKILPCQPYLLGSAAISAPCCLAAQALNTIATTKPQIKALCVCFKQAAIAFGIDTERLKKLPQLCHITVPVPLDPKIDCNRI